MRHQKRHQPTQLTIIGVDLRTIYVVIHVPTTSDPLLRPYAVVELRYPETPIMTTIALPRSERSEEVAYMLLIRGGADATTKSDWYAKRQVCFDARNYLT